MKFQSYEQPVLTCSDAQTYEASVLSDAAEEWSAMKRAGCGLARMIIDDYSELRLAPQRLRVLGLIGKGNNGGDALIACGQILADFPRAHVDLILTHPADEQRPLAAKAFQQLEGRVQTHAVSESQSTDELSDLLQTIGGDQGFHICIDGLLGMSFTPPLREPFAALIEAVNAYDLIDLRASVDLPSGRGDMSSELTFRADFSYATGIAKRPLFEGVADCGRIRYVDLGLFDSEKAQGLESTESILLPRVLDPLRRLRPAAVDKRHFGHIFIVGGSAYMPGALLMAVKAAVRSGAGLVTAFAPSSVASALAAQVPEAMWIPWPESSNGTLTTRALPLLLDRVDQASAVLLGPGMGKDRNTELLTQEILRQVEQPVILDADALRSRVVEVAQKRKPQFGPVVITPHMGEFMRMAKLSKPDYSSKALLDFTKFYRVVTVLKGANTRICDGQSIAYNTLGGPVLSRGGSGDILAGLIGGMVAQDNSSVTEAVARGVVLHGLAAQRLARAKGQVAVHTVEVLDYLHEVLREV